RINTDVSEFIRVYLWLLFDAALARPYAGHSEQPHSRLHPMKRTALLLALLTPALPIMFAADDKKEPPKDSRLGPPVDLNKSYFPFNPPKTKEAWETRRKEVREQMLVALGLWPLPEKTPLKPVVHGKIDRKEYTIEKVFFASVPGHYVSGNLYHPVASRERKLPDKLPAVLFPHAHRANRR